MSELREFFKKKEQYRQFRSKLYRRYACPEGRKMFSEVARTCDYDLLRTLTRLREKFLQESRGVSDDKYLLFDVPPVLGFVWWFFNQPEFTNGGERNREIETLGPVKRRVKQYSAARVVKAYLRDPRELSGWRRDGDWW